MKPRRILLPVLGALLGLSVLAWLALTLPLGLTTFAPDASADRSVPLDPSSPWPKFRSNALQNGRSAVVPVAPAESRPWVHRTGKGIFSSAVIGGGGEVYLGSADQHFYALGADGTLTWKFLTGGIIDSSALLDAHGRVIFGAGDGKVYALDRGTGKSVWTFTADSPEEAKRKYQLDIHNVGWFEGNIGLLPDGTLLAPNDNQLVYALDPSGKEQRVFRGNEMVWSLPAVDAANGRLFFATQNLALKTVFAYSFVSGASPEPLWTAGNLGSLAASLLLTSSRPDAAVVGGAFDGSLRAWQASTGRQVWEFTARDHLYASPAQLSTGTLVQPSADGTIYGLDSSSGRELWAFDTGEPIRSSPAVDGKDQIYVGGGDGRLYCLNADGTLRWSWLCIEGDRNDLNSSPALGPTGVVIGGEDGGIFFVPYDYPLTALGKADPRSRLGAWSTLGEGAHLVPTQGFGALHPEGFPIAANQPITLTLIAKQGGKVVDARLTDKLEVRVTAPSGLDVGELRLSADNRFLVVVPSSLWASPDGGNLTLHVKATWLAGPVRFGLKAFGGRFGGELEQDLTFAVLPRAPLAFPYTVPSKPGETAGRFSLARLAAPNPTMLPSWNQIGFDSLHYVAAVVEGEGPNALLWVVGGKLDPASGATVVDPSLEARFPLELRWEDGLVTLENRRGFLTNFVGSWSMPFGSWRVSARVASPAGDFAPPTRLDAVALADQIPFYGLGLKLLGLSAWEDGHLTVAGGLELAALPPLAAPPGAGIVSFGKDGADLVATLTGATLRRGEHNFSLLALDAGGKALPLDYTNQTRVDANSQGVVTGLRVHGASVPGRHVRVVFLVDALPVATGSLEW